MALINRITKHVLRTNSKALLEKHQSLIEFEMHERDTTFNTKSANAEDQNFKDYTKIVQ